MVGPEEVQRVAKLAKLALAPSEVEALAEQLGRILAYVELLKEVDGASPLAAAQAPAAGSSPADAPEPADEPPLGMRPDEPGDVLSRVEVLRQAPGADAEMFRVPPVLEDGGHA